LRHNTATLKPVSLTLRLIPPTLGPVNITFKLKTPTLRLIPLTLGLISLNLMVNHSK